MKTKLQSGVALVITLLMLSVITFMTVAFLAVSQRNRASVTVTMDAKDAQAMADAALARAQIDLVSSLISNKDALNYDLMVSRNFINTNGFHEGVGSDDPTNVNYDFDLSGWNESDRVQNIANLLYDPRPPVYVKVNTNADFRFWVDLNQNGRFETNGNDLEIYDDQNFVITNGTLVGEPEWIGVLKYPDYHHSETNPFVGRFAYLICPVGKTLDINFIHNYAKRTDLMDPLNDYFLRNQGVGSWELNLAAYFSSLNTNSYGWGGVLPGNVTNYVYVTNSANPSTGKAFNSAVDILAYRYNRKLLPSAFDFYGPSAPTPFTNSTMADLYSDGPLQLTTAAVGTNEDARLPWSGSDNTNALYQPADFFAETNSSFEFTNTLSSLVSSNSTYNRYTFQRMLATMGTDTAPELQGKININYSNNPSGHMSQTNFVDWTPLDFFTNTADKLLRQHYSFGVSAIPIYTTNWFTNYVGTNIVITYGTNLYTPAVHRMLQLAANIYDATTTNEFPSVFRPVFMSTGGTNYICGYTTNKLLSFFRLYPWANISQYPLNGLPITATGTNYYSSNVWGAPVIIGVKKGLPNFNEVTFATAGTVVRKLEFWRATTNSPAIETNQLYLFKEFTNAVAIELWNSYRTNYAWDVSVQYSNHVHNSMTVDGRPIKLNNLTPTNWNYSFSSGQGVNINAKQWQGSGRKESFISFTNGVSFLPTCGYNEYLKCFDTNLGYSTFANGDLPRGYGLPVHDFEFTVTNQLYCALLANGGSQLIDFVTLSTPGNKTNLSSALSDSPRTSYYFSRTNSTTNSVYDGRHVPAGISNELEIISGTLKQWLAGTLITNNDGALHQQSDVQDVYAKVGIVETYQANDPLVHYTLGDMSNPKTRGSASIQFDSESAIYMLTNTIGSIGKANVHYWPWSTDQKQTNIFYNDPYITCSDDWSFPTNKFPNIGWLGRVHRGTPWQTVFLKADTDSRAHSAYWRLEWVTDPNFETYPTTDYRILDCFTTAPNDNAARGLLSVNQTNVSAWSAVLSGVIALTNDSPTQPLVIAPDDVTNFVSGYVTANNVTNLGINGVRNGFTNQVFHSVGDILTSPTLTVASPYIDFSKPVTDAVVERIPQQILSLLQVGQPRFVIYSYGQSLKPRDVYQGIENTNYNICTNYQITGETLTRTVCHVVTDGSSTNIVVDSYNNVTPTE